MLKIFQDGHEYYGQYYTDLTKAEFDKSIGGIGVYPEFSIFKYITGYGENALLLMFDSEIDDYEEI